MLLLGCSAGTAATPRAVANQPTGRLSVLAVETFLADITRNVAGTRADVQALLPLGADPHSFEPTPADVAKVANSAALIINGQGLEDFLQKLLDSAGGRRAIINASRGLPVRTPSAEESGGVVDTDHPLGDPHFWLAPTQVMSYVVNIRDGLIGLDPAGANEYRTNADAYLQKLRTLDLWVREQAAQIPVERRVLVTNHESLGYYADAYGFKIIGAIVPSVSSSASPSAQQLARLIDRIKAAHAPAVFLEAGTNATLAEQLARETGIRVVTGLYTHSTSAPDGPAPDYIGMIRYNTTAIIEALK
jgi:ABC-type Zn uptake system ZnuABC Zn-binding protein ZnuA